MGIQASLNQLTGTFWRGIAAIGTGVKALAKYNEKNVSQASQSKEAKEPKPENPYQGYIFKNEKRKRNPYKSAIDSANGAIGEKALAKTFSIDERIKEATSLSIIDKGGNE